MIGITPRLSGCLVRFRCPLKTFYLARHSNYIYIDIYKIYIYIYKDVTSYLSVLITASGLQGEKPLANGIK